MTTQQKNMLTRILVTAVLYAALVAADHMKTGAPTMSFTLHCATVSRGHIKEVLLMRNVKTISISIPLDVLALVDQAAKETGLTRSSFISWALSTNEQVKGARKNGAV